MLPKLTSAVNTGLEMLLLLSGSEGGQPHMLPIMGRFAEAQLVMT